MERLAALEAEVKADAEAQRARKAAAIAKLRDQRVTATASGEPSVRTRAVRPPAASPDDPDDDPGDSIDERRRARSERRRARSERGEAEPLDNLSGALELASKANRVKQELQRTPRKGEKSWLWSGGLSLVAGPIGWLYAGSLREAVPATAGWIALAILASKILPVFLLTPVLMLALPLSAIAGVVYALQYNRAGKRQRLFGDDKAKDKPKQLRSGRTAS
jgi:hypothetical protein